MLAGQYFMGLILFRCEDEILLIYSGELLSYLFFETEVVMQIRSITESIS